jgi:DNA-binding transcriptional ArsR family regulator
MWFDQISFTHLLQAPSNRPLQRFKAEFFQALAHPVRITILEALRDGALTVGDLQERLAIDASSVSQQLAVLRARDIVEGRRVGSTVYYTVRDPALFHLLDVAREIFNNHLIDLREMQEVVAAQARGDEERGVLS